MRLAVYCEHVDANFVVSPWISIYFFSLVDCVALGLWLCFNRIVNILLAIIYQYVLVSV
jgi:hypothetical protein